MEALTISFNAHCFLTFASPFVFCHKENVPVINLQSVQGNPNVGIRQTKPEAKNQIHVALSYEYVMKREVEKGHILTVQQILILPSIMYHLIDEIYMHSK